MTLRTNSQNPEKSGSKQPTDPGLLGWMAPADQASSNPQSGIAPDDSAENLEIHNGFFCSGSDSIYVSADSTLLCAITGRLTLEEPSSESASAEALAELYRSDPSTVGKHLGGHFSAVILDVQRSEARLFTDKVGSCAIYVAQSSAGLFFGTSAKSVSGLLNATTAPSTADKLNHQSLYNYVYFHMIPASATIYTALTKLQAATCVTASTANPAPALERAYYWTPSFKESTAQNTKEELKLRLRDTLRSAVASAMPLEGKSGAFLSGGLDSSTVAGMLSEIQGGTCDAYAIGFDAAGYDEMAYARITAEHFGIKLHEYYVTPDDIVSALPKIVKGYDEPFGNSSALPAYFCAQMAADDGISTLLAGDGGDEIFAGNERYAKQKTFHYYERTPKIIRETLLPSLLALLPSSSSLARKSQSYISQAKTALPARLQTYNFLHQNAPGDVFAENFLREVDTAIPLSLLESVYHEPKAASELNRMLYLDWQFTLADNDLRKVSQACALASVKVSYPMLDDELIALSMEIPSEWKLPARKLRDFYKQALQGWLPEATLNKSKHGFGLPFGIWMKDHKPLQELAYSNILALRERDIFKPAFLEQAIAQHRDGHAAYYGELIWVLMVLELWLAENESTWVAQGSL